MTRALLLGATGLVGSATLRLLLEEPGVSELAVLGRRPCGSSHPKLRETVADLSAPEAFADALAVDVVFCCLGTTIKKAGSREQFRRVDHDVVLGLARAAQRAGARSFLLVSSAGADPRSFNFYLRVKGELEEALSALSFASLEILRPSLLTGPRAEFRLIERVAEPLMRALSPILPPRHRPIAAESVARAMVRLAREGTPGARTHESDAIASLAKA